MKNTKQIINFSNNQNKNEDKTDFEQQIVEESKKPNFSIKINFLKNKKEKRENKSKLRSKKIKYLVDPAKKYFG